MKSLITFLIAMIVATPDYKPNMKEGLIIIGDSRTRDMEEVTKGISHEHVFFIAEDGQGYQWFVNKAQGKANDIIRSHGEIENWIILINLGINDIMNLSSYKKEYIRLHKEEWRGHHIYVTAVNPVVPELCTSVSNFNIYQFNEKMEEIEEAGIPFINITFFVEEHMNTKDGLHFDGETSIKIYEKYLKNIEELERKMHVEIE
ncbi:hypothetical protein D7X25_30285 [bacterium 1XD42-8]|jgi:hypothetical protein|nr:hypothetical protein [Lachnospiraceae bacterium]RKJ38643.1 hypothetical protein D7X25_30285 [bacterium 1XD42-8]